MPCSSLAAAAATAWAAAEARKTLSNAEEQLADTLQGMGFRPLRARWLQPATLALDSSTRLLVPTPVPVPALRVRVGLHAGATGTRPLALELLPPIAMTCSVPRRPLGQAALRAAALRAAGWRVVCLPADTWVATAQQSAAAQHALLKTLLAPEEDG